MDAAVPRPRSPRFPSALPRRTALTGAMSGAAALAALGLGACAPPNAGSVNTEAAIPPADGPVTITYWAWLKDLQKVADIFNAQQDRIRVQATWIPGGNSGGYAKILSAVAAGGGPDIAQVELRSLAEFALAGALVDLARYDAGEHEGLFDPSAWAQAQIGESIWGIPQDTGPVPFFYNRVVLEDELGLAPPATWDDFRTTAQLVKDAGKTLMTINPVDGSFITMVMMQSGANWFTPEGSTWKVDLTGEASMRVAEFWDQILADGTVGTGYGPFTTPWMAAAGDGQVVANISGSWGDALIAAVPGAAGKWAVADMPRWPDGYASGGHGGSSAAVLANSKHPAEALEFLVWMCSTPEGIDAMIEHSGIGWSPAVEYVGAAREEPSEFFSGQNYNMEVVQPMARGQNLDWVWGPITQRMLNMLGDGMVRVVNGELTFVDLMPEVQGQIVDVMRGIGLDVEVAQ